MMTDESGEVVWQADYMPFGEVNVNVDRVKEEELSEVHLRLATVTIENLPWQEFIKRYDRPQTFFYCDPPYYKAPYYEHNFELEDYHELAAELTQLKGEIHSEYKWSKMRKAFKGFNIKPVELKYSVSKGPLKDAKELLISNF